MNKFKKKQSGVTLLELVVSLGIGVILLTALGRVYVSATNEDATRTLRAELDEAARQIFSTMARDISLAGFVDNFDGGTTTGRPNGNKVLVQSGNIKKLFNREDNEITALSLLTGKNYMLPIQGDDKHLTIVYQAKNSEDIKYSDGQDYRSLSGAFAYGVGAGKNAGIGEDTENISGWGMNCVNNTDSALIDHEGNKNSDPKLNLYLKQDFVFNDNDKTFSCGMAAWNNNYETTNNSATTLPNLDTTGQMKALVGDANAKDRVTSVDSVRFRYTVTSNEHPSTDNYTVAESIAGYYTDKILNHTGVKASNLGWGGVTGVEVCIVIAANPTFGKKKIADIASVQPEIPTCERESEDSTGDVSGANFKTATARQDGDTKYYARYVRTLSAHNALYLR